MRVRGLCGAVLGLVLMVSGGMPALGVPVARPASHHGSAPSLCREQTFEGAVSEGRSFRRAIGGGLEFELEAVPQGWAIRVLPATGRRPEEDFAEVATPPFHSVNPLLLTTDFGFRAQDVIGWNPRTFRYVASIQEFAGAQRAYRAATSSRAPTWEQEKAVTDAVLKALEGRLEITDAELVPGTADQARSAGLVASHFGSTAHTVRAPTNAAAGPLGEVVAIHFRVRLSGQERTACRGSTKFAGNQ